MSTSAPVESPPRACPMCGSDNHGQPANPYSQTPWLLKTCANCGFTYLENPPTYAALEEDFAWEKTSAAEETRRRAARPLAKRLSTSFKHFRQKILKRDHLLALLGEALPRGRVLDLGCGSGGVLARLPADRYKPYGVEISRALAALSNAIAEPRGGRVVRADALSGLASFPADFFDGALLSGFLEHETQPAPLLQALLRVLRPRAPVIVKVPNYACVNRHVRGARWCGFRHPDHVNYFTPGSLAQIASSNGFRVSRCSLADRWPLSDNLWMVFEKPAPGAGR